MNKSRGFQRFKYSKIFAKSTNIHKYLFYLRKFTNIRFIHKYLWIFTDICGHSQRLVITSIPFLIRMHMNVCMLVYLYVWLLVYLSHASCHVHQLNSPYGDAAAHRVCVFYLAFVDLTDSGFICFICKNSRIFADICGYSRIFADIHKYWFYSQIFVLFKNICFICGVLSP